MGKGDAEEGRQAGEEEGRNVSPADCDDLHGHLPYHGSAVRLRSEDAAGAVTAEKIMSTEFPRLKTIEEDPAIAAWRERCKTFGTK